MMKLTPAYPKGMLKNSTLSLLLNFWERRTAKKALGTEAPVWGKERELTKKGRHRLLFGLEKESQQKIKAGAGCYLG